MVSMRLSLLLVLILLLAGAAALGFFYFDFSQTFSQAATSPSGTPLQKNLQEAFLLPQTQVNYLPIRDFNIPDPIITARAVGLYDIVSDKFLYAKEPDRQVPIASVTKLMTAVIIKENINISDIITVAPENINVDGQGADLVKGERIVVADLLKIMLIKSSNDAAASFANYAKQQGIDLVAKMNEKAKEIGMNQTRYLDPSGLNDNGVSTVKDLVLLVKYINDQHSDIWRILRTQSETVASYDGINSHALTSTNALLGQMSGIIGGKTGYTDRAMGTMVLQVSLQDGENMVISIILGSSDRFGETKKLIDWGNTAYRWK